MKLRKFKALVSETGLDDGGVASFTFKVDQLTKGKVYTQQDGSHFIDDNGCWRNIDDMIIEGKIKEIK
jgi:hypothetical protein